MMIGPYIDVASSLNGKIDLQSTYHNQYITKENQDYRIDVSPLVASKEGAMELLYSVHAVLYKSGCFRKVYLWCLYAV